MAAEKTSVPDKEIKVESENVSQKENDKRNEVMVTNLLSEIRTTDLPKESPIQVEKSEEKEPKSSGNEKEKLKDVDNRINKEKGDKKEEEVKKADNVGKEAEEKNKKADDAKKMEKDGKKLEEEKKPESGDKKNESSRKSSSKSKNESPLAEYFQDWDKFTTQQKIDIERFIKEKAEKMGASSKLKPGVRTFSERERNWFKRNAIMRR